MPSATPLKAVSHLTLQAETAVELMTPNPMSIRADATVQEAIALLIDRSFGAAPVIDEAGRPIGVLSRADILIHEREQHCHTSTRRSERVETKTQPKEDPESSSSIEKEDPLLVRDLMTPVVFSVSPDTPAVRVIEELLALKVHRLFVVDASSTLIGAITSLDILRHLRPE